MPFYISVWRMNHAFRKPAEAQAKNELVALYTYAYAPLMWAVRPDMAFLISKPIVIDDAQAAQ